MFKKMFTMIMVMAMMVGIVAVPANAVVLSEEGRADFVGMEYFEAVYELNKRHENGEFEIDYELQMVHVEDYWVVNLEGEADAYWGYSAMGIYDHMPTEEEIDILWANRMTDDEFIELFEKYETQYEES